MALNTIIIAVLYLLHSAAARSGVCILGSTEVTETNFLDDGGQYLDFGNPATCTGNLIAWHFCYYAADITESDTYVVFLRVWRMVDGNSFQRIDDNPLNMAIDPPSNGQTLICENVTLSTALDVQRNDILGVYVPTTSLFGGPPLHIVARDTTNFGIFADTRTFMTPLLSTTISTTDLENRTTLGLHLYADIVINCGNLTDPDDGQVAFTPGVVATIDTGFGATAAYTCIEGYSLLGNSVRTCQEIGVWDGAEPTCMLIDCGNLTDPDRGQVTFTPGVVVTVETGLGAVENYTCNEAYDLLGDAQRTCEENGQWDGGEPMCMLIDCGNLTAPKGGQIMFTPGVAATTDSGLNAVAAYSCNEGYNLDGDQIRTCQGSGEWTRAAPTCILIDCGNLAALEGGQVTFTPGVVMTLETGLEAIAVYTCNDGYNLVGDTMRACQANEQWAGTEPNCMLINCGGLTDPEDGRVTFTPGVVMTLETGLEAIAVYTCNDGYNLVGDTMRACQANEQWAGTEPNCMLINCGGLTVPEDGQVTFTPGVVMTIETGLGAVATYTCSEGYDLVGADMRTCQANEQWAGTEPHCMTIDCGNLIVPEDGQISFTPGVVMTLETGLDAVANYTCSEGFDLVGDAMRTCQANEQWTGTEPNCTLIDCGNLTIPEDGEVTFTPGVVMTLETGFGAIASYTCSEGYDLIGDEMRTCQVDGQWTGAELTCMLINCTLLNDPENGQVIFTPGVVATIETGLGAVANYTCNGGYDLVGETLRTCEANGQWAGAEPTCTLIDCGNLTDPEDGQVMFTPGVVATIETGLGAIANYTCNDGYDLVGDVLRTCQANEQWAGTEPTCSLIDCGNLTDPEGGQVTFTPGVVMALETGLDAIATYTCNDGYNLVGDTMRVCQANEQWAGTEPNCMLINCGGLTDPEDGQVSFTPGVVMTLATGLDAIATYTCTEGYNLVGDVMRTCQANERWAGIEPNCTPIDCGDLTNPEGGQVTFTPGGLMTLETGLDAVANYTCNEGYDLVGDAMRTCQANEQWAGTESNCIPIDCGHLIIPEGGQVTFTPGVVMTLATGLEAIAVYTCNDGYDLVGDAMRTCQASGQWNRADPTCTLINCGVLTNPSNGQVTVTSGVVTETGVGALATYTCNEGYQLNGNAVRACQDTGDWNLLAPICLLINCGSLDNPENGTVTINPGIVSATGLNAVAIYTCNEGYNRIGDATRTCRLSGEWDGAEPTCSFTPMPPDTSIQLGPVVGGAVAGVVVVVLVAMVIIFGTVHVFKRKNSTNDLQSKVFNRKSDQATLTHFQHTEIDVETSRNEAYITSAETFHNEAYITNIATSLNKAYGAYQSTDDRGADEYNYVINPLITCSSSGEGNDEPAVELYDYVRGEYTPRT